MITSIITGDIIKSRTQANPELWMNALKHVLATISTDKKQWNVYRGDSFQIEITDYYTAFKHCVYIKACMKTLGFDVRLAIGIGSKTYEGSNVSESNGDAFIYAGETLEKSKKEKQHLCIKTANFNLDETLNLYFKLALIAMDNWTKNAAEIVKLSIENPNALQAELGNMIGINQNAVSTRQKRAYLSELLELDLMYRKKINSL